MTGPSEKPLRHLFEGKDKTDPACRFQGVTTKVGASEFEFVRAWISERFGITKISDAVVFEYAARVVARLIRRKYRKNKEV